METNEKQSTFLQDSLDDLIAGCSQETKEKKRKSKTNYCFELFRRALVDKDNEAWMAVRNQYHNLVRHWIREKIFVDHESLDDLEQDTWEKLLQSLGKRPSFFTEKFEHVGAILSYLRHCAFTSAVDEYRRRQRREAIETKFKNSLFVENRHFREDIDKKEAVSQVKSWIHKVTDPQERLLLFLSYEQGLTPKEIALQYPDEFENVKVVRRIKERLVKRAQYTLIDQNRD